MSFIFSCFAQNSRPKTHKVEFGQSVYKISRLYNIEVDSIYFYNPILKERGLKAEEIIYLSPNETSVMINKVPKMINFDSLASKPTFHKIQAKETLYKIAKMYSISIDSIYAFNPSLRGRLFQIDEIIHLVSQKNRKDTIVLENVTSKPDTIANKINTFENSNVYSHKLKYKETLYKISKMYNVKMDSIYFYNPELKSRPAKIDEIIILRSGYIPSTIVEEVNIPVVVDNQGKYPKIDSLTLASIPNEYLRIHKVEAGQTIFKIAKIYSIKVDTLLYYNPEKRNGSLNVDDIVILGINPRIKDTTEIKPTIGRVIEPYKGTDSEIKLKKEPDFVLDSNAISATSDKVKTVDKLANKTAYVPSYKNSVKQVLVVPFKPDLYFSDSDADIANNSKIDKHQVKIYFRNRLNDLLKADNGSMKFNMLLRGQLKDSTMDLDKAYKSMNFNYESVVLKNPEDNLLTDVKNKKSKKVSSAPYTRDEGKYYSVKILNPDFFKYFNEKYKLDYYVFINQFEISTDVDKVLNKLTHNYERNFIVHFTIYNNLGEKVSGDRYTANYNSNTNSIQKILNENMPKISKYILSQIP